MSSQLGGSKVYLLAATVAACLLILVNPAHPLPVRLQGQCPEGNRIPTCPSKQQQQNVKQKYYQLRHEQQQRNVIYKYHQYHQLKSKQKTPKVVVRDVIPAPRNASCPWGYTRRDSSSGAECWRVP